MNKKLKLTIKYFLIRKAKEIFPFVLMGVAVFTPLIIAENFFGFDFDQPCTFCSFNPPFGMRFIFILGTVFAEFSLYLISIPLWNWLKANWFLARIDAQYELRKRRKQKKRRKQR